MDEQGEKKLTNNREQEQGLRSAELMLADVQDNLLLRVSSKEISTFEAIPFGPRSTSHHDSAVLFFVVLSAGMLPPGDGLFHGEKGNETFLVSGI